MTLLIVIVILALVFDYINGFHDAANSIATVVSTKVLTPFQAVFWAAAFNFVAFFIFKEHAVANTIGNTVHKDYITLPVILSGLIAAISWNLLTWWYGIPSSSSHTLIGGFAGAALTHAFLRKGASSFNVVLEMQYIVKILLFIFLAPFIGMIVSIFITTVNVMRNTWLKIALLLVSAVGIWFLFQYYKQEKLDKHLARFYRIEQLQKEAAKDPVAQAKLDSVKGFIKKAKPYLLQYNDIGPSGIAKNIKMNIDPSVDVNKLSKDLHKADNSIQLWVILGLILIFISAYIYSEKIKTPNAYRVARVYKKLQLFSSAAFSVGHGGNDAQKVMGLIGAAFVAYYGTGKYPDASAVLKDLTWVPLACYTAIGLGTMSGGWRIIKTMGTKITKVTPLEGVCAESAGAFTLFITEQMGIPVSTTHTITGSIIGVGATKRLSAVRWGVTVSLLWAWILTIPVSALLAGLIYFITSFFIQ